MNNFGQFTVSSFLPPAQPLNITTGVSWEYIRIINNSAYLLNVNLAGMGTIVMPEYFLEDIYLPQSYRGSLVIIPQTNVTVTGHSTSNMISINGYQQGEISQPQAQPLSQPAVTTTASGKPIFSAQWGVTPSSGIVEVLNIFNPANSGVVATFHSARVFTTDAGTGVIANLQFQPGADANRAFPVSAVSHSGVATPPISVMHCTGDDSSTGLLGTSIEIMQIAPNVLQDFLTFPDNTILVPGGNLGITLAASGSGKFSRLNLKWTEDTVVPPIAVTGATAVASSLENDGNPAGTQLIESTVAGDGTSAVLLTNDAQFTLGDVLHPGTIGGLFSFLAGINMQVPQVTHAGSVSGSANLYEAMQGNVHFLFITLISYQDAADQELVIPHAFQNGIAFFQSGTVGVAGAGGVSVDNSGTLRTLAIITSIAAAGGTTSAQTGLFSASFAYLGGGTFNQVRILASGGVTRTGHVIIIGN